MLWNIDKKNNTPAATTKQLKITSTEPQASFVVGTSSNVSAIVSPQSLYIDTTAISNHEVALLKVQMVDLFKEIINGYVADDIKKAELLNLVNRKIK